MQIHEEADPLQAKNLFNLEGKRWKDMRSKLVPTFTSGKMKNMLPLMQEVAAEFDTKLKELTESKEEFEIRVINLEPMERHKNTSLKLHLVFAESCVLLLYRHCWNVYFWHQVQLN